jgi:hypothetical protein
MLKAGDSIDGRYKVISVRRKPLNRWRNNAGHRWVLRDTERDALITADWRDLKRMFANGKAKGVWSDG